MTTDSKPTKSRRKKTPTSSSKPMTKKDQLIRMLGNAAGADVTAISTKLGWQAHTTRAALSGLRKAGYDVVTEKPGQGKPARYRIVGTPAATAGAAPAAALRKATDAG